MEVPLDTESMGANVKTSKTKDPAGFKDYYDRWDQLEVSDDEEDDDRKADAELQAKMVAVQEAEVAAQELHQHVERVQLEGDNYQCMHSLSCSILLNINSQNCCLVPGPGPALEEDVDALGLGDCMEDGWSTDCGVHEPNNPMRQDTEQVANISTSRFEGSSLQTTSDVVWSGRSKASCSLDYSRWNSIVKDDSDVEDEDEPQQKDPSQQREELLTLANQFESFKLDRRQREKEREEYWSKRSVFRNRD